MAHRFIFASIFAVACSGAVSSDDAGMDAATRADAGDDAAIGMDAGSDASMAIDAGSDASSDAGSDAGQDAGPPDGGPPDAGPTDSGPIEPDAGTDGGPSAMVFVLGAPGDNCDMTCGAIGLACRGSGSVGLDCGEHNEIPTCNDPANWIYRNNPATKPLPYCRADWGTSEVCGNNYNVSNAFCCKCSPR